MIQDWRPEEFKRQLRNDLVANGEIVGKFVETEARRRLLALDDITVQLSPTRTYYGGAAYRKYVASLMMYEVEEQRDAVEIRVGVGQGRSGSHHGIFIELGTSLFAPRPFLRPAVFENADKIRALLAGQ